MGPEQRINGISYEHFLQDYRQNPQDYKRVTHRNRNDDVGEQPDEYIETRSGQVVIWHNNRVYVIPPGLVDPNLVHYQKQHNQQFLADLDARSLHQRKVNLSPTTNLTRDDHKWLNFYNGRGSLAIGQRNTQWTIDRVLSLDENNLECQHDFIQLLFPGIDPERIPLLTPALIAQIKDDPVIYSNVIRSLDVMLHHWGIEREGHHFVARHNRPKKLARWITRGDHNELRISRMLHFFRLCGCADFARDLCFFLQQERKNYGQKPNFHWYKAAGVNGKSSAHATSTRTRNHPSEHPLVNSEPHRGEKVTIGSIHDRSGYQPQGLKPIIYSIPLLGDRGEPVQAEVRSGNYIQAANCLIERSRGTAWEDVLNSQPHGSHRGVIRFYDRNFNLDTYYLSNTYVHRERGRIVPVQIDGRRYPSVEHYFQCMKFIASARKDADKAKLEQAIQTILSKQRASTAKQAAYSEEFKKLIDFQKWNKMREKVMMDGISAKFSQIPELRNRLCASYPNILIEQTGDDKFWGNGGNDTGGNKTGQILGMVREQLLSQLQHQ